ncbi:hypothetical protein RHGRI_030272 [Rhododendron griersonianum]|uniref:Uncharacterized protein n=1 Tax=Rhododendron griersonianum TaxID=479676 RepID=A0AAV6IM99_9ERIC|nr:hypothetical protein RHGRI_030272 [Rhododendron griersonianum]
MGFSSLNRENKIENRENKIENKENKNGNLGEVEVVDSISSECSSGVSSVGSLESDLMEDEVTSSASSPNSPPPPPSASNSSGQIASTSPLHDMSSLMQQLPIKRGLSKYFQGKSQSFTSLTNVRSLEDLAKPENPYNKKLKSCKSYVGLLSAQNHHTSSSSHHLPRANSSSRLITKKASNSRGSCSSLGAKRTPSFVGNNRAPIPSAPPHGSTGTLCSFSNQNPLFV